MAAGYLGNPDVTLEIPDLADLAGWDPSFSFVAGDEEVFWDVHVEGSNRTVADTFAGMLQLPARSLRPGLDGFETTTVYAVGTIQP